MGITYEISPVDENSYVLNHERLGCCNVCTYLDLFAQVDRLANQLMEEAERIVEVLIIHKKKLLSGFTCAKSVTLGGVPL